MIERDPRLMALASRIGPNMRAEAKVISQEEWDEQIRDHGERDFGYVKKDGNYEKWDPAERSGHLPQPRWLRQGVGKERPTWEDYLVEENFDQDFIICGAGEGALRHGRDLDGKIVYGINWTTRWFHPTFLQAIDTAVWNQEIRSPRVHAEGRTQVVVSRWLMNNQVPALEDHDKYLTFDIVHPALKRNYYKHQFAETHKQTIGWAPNSLFFALNIAHWFRPRRIVLVGFDFGGAHLFGDGRQVDARGDYGFNSKAKEDLHDRLRWMRDEMEKRGNIIKHVGPTKLDVFNTVDTVEEALR